MADRSPSGDRGTERLRERDGPQGARDKAVGSAASVLGLLVDVASVSSPSRTGLWP